jgi:hypothetical protein
MIYLAATCIWMISKIFNLGEKKLWVLTTLTGDKNWGVLTENKNCDVLTDKNIREKLWSAKSATERTTM